ncbi:MAG TPA: oxidoreductase-like domain-containing protein [Casimicrobiaceae bacterium]|nr:oxidoreductase-like domain-containing protein [Casimicrobiaceae bacterium]
MSELPADDDPPPVPPVRPGQDDCCKGSCDPCVFDLYEEALERYHAELAAWQERSSDRKKALGRPASA